MSDQILKMCSRAGSDQNLRMGEDGGASSLEESKCLAGIFQQIVNDCKVSSLLSSFVLCISKVALISSHS